MKMNCFLKGNSHFFLKEKNFFRKVELLLQKLSEINDRSQIHNKALRKVALKVSSRLNPNRYKNTYKILLERARINPLSVISSQIKEDIETSFLMDLKEYKSDFKPLNVYNINQSITLKPTENFVRNLFKVI